MDRLEHVLRDRLTKALNRSKLVRVQRPVTRKGKTYMTHKWVRPEKVRKTDTVIAGKDVYEKWQKEQAANGKAPAPTKPDSDGVTGTSSDRKTTGKPSGMSRVNAVMAKRRKAKADAARAQAAKQDPPKTDTAKPDTAKPNPKPDSKPSDSKAKPDSKPADTKAKAASKPTDGKTSTVGKAGTAGKAGTDDKTSTAGKAGTDDKTSTAGKAGTDDKTSTAGKAGKDGKDGKTESKTAAARSRGKSAGDKAESKPKRAPRAKKQTPPAPRPPFNRADADKLGANELGPRKLKTTLASMRSELDATALTTDIASGEREQAYVSMLNQITDKELLKQIAHTGIIPENEGATWFLQEKLYPHYREVSEADRVPEGPPSHKYTYQVAYDEFASTVRSYFPDSDTESVKDALQKTCLAEGEFAFRLLHPAESSMILGSWTQGNRQVYAHANSMHPEHSARTSPLNLFGVGDWFATSGESTADGISTLMDHIAAQQPDLADECNAWAREFSELMDVCGGNPETMRMALCNTYDKVADVVTKDQYNEILSRTLKLYGASISDGGNTVFDGDYTTMTTADSLRLTYADTGSDARRAVMANIMNAQNVMEMASTVYRHGGSELNRWPDRNSTQDVAANLNAVKTISTKELDEMRAFVENTVDTPNSVEGNPEYTRAKRTAVFPHYVEGQDVLKNHVSPVTDMFRRTLESAASFGDSDPKGLPHTEYDPSTLKPAREFNTPDFTEDDELLGLRAMAFANAKCSIARMDETEEAAFIAEETGDIEDKKHGGKLYAERVAIVRAAYKVSNSVMEENYEARREQDDYPEEEVVYHGTGFGAGAAIMGGGAFKFRNVKKACGQSMGPGIYFGYALGKVLPYAATGQAFAAESAELMYENDDYSPHDYADGVILKGRVSHGKKYYEGAFAKDAKAMNKNSDGDGDADTVATGGYKGWEIAVTSADLANVDVIMDTGVRYNDIDPRAHDKNVGKRMKGFGMNIGKRTNRQDDNSIVNYYIKYVNERER